mgnify:CR=1 FL=1
MGKIEVVIGADVCMSYLHQPVDAPYCRRLLAPVKPILDDADFRIADLESPLCAEGVGAKIPKSGPNLRADPQNIAFLTEGGFDCAILANNHFGDYGEPAIASTLDILGKNRIAALGGGMNVGEAYRAWYAEKDGIRIAFLAVCENEFGCATEDRAGAAGFSLKRLRDRMVEEKQNSDFLVILFHGGNEYDPFPSPETVDRYRLLIDLGADALVAMHTHCMQGYETYGGKPIIYSMGNFFFPQEPYKDGDSWNYGYLTALTFQKGKSVTFAVHPYILRDNNAVLHLCAGDEKAKMLAYLDKISAVIRDPVALRRYFRAWCVMSGAHYAKTGLSYTSDFEAGGLTAEQKSALARTRNLFWCEAHAGLMRGLLALELEGGIEDARADMDALKAYSVMPV